MKYVVLALFVAVLIGVGYVSRRRTATVGEFFLGGRDVGPWLSSFAFGTTYFSAVLFVGYAGKVGYGFGLPALWIVVGNALVGSLLAWWLLAARTRSMTERLNAMTMPEFLRQRFASRPLKVVAAVIIFVFLVPYSASVYTGLAYLFEKTFGLDYTWALVLMAALTALYLVLGGYLAVARNDLIQGVVMVVGVVLMVVFVLRAPEVGGLSTGLERLGDISPGLASWWPGWHFDTSSAQGVFGAPGLMLLSLVALTSLGTWGLPQMVHKFYAIKDRRVVRPAMVITTLFAGLMAFGAYFTGALSRLFPQAAPFAEKGEYDAIMPTVINEALPEVLVVIILLLVLSASMSTLAGLVMISASVITVDLVQGEVKPDLSKRSGVLLMRILVVVFIALSVLLAQQKIAIILTLMALSWGIVAGAFIGPFVWSLWWRGVTKWGAWAGMLGGVLITLVPTIVWGTAYVPVFASAAMVGSLVLVPLVSLVTPRLQESLVARAFGDGGQDEAAHAETAASLPPQPESAVAAVEVAEQLAD